MSLWKDPELEYARARLEAARDIIDDYIAWADEYGYRAVSHKLEEAWGPLNSAMTAVAQYDDGELVPRDE